MNGTKLTDAKSARCHLELFLGDGCYENLLEKSTRWRLFAQPHCVSGTRRAHVQITFYVRKQNGSRNPEKFYRTCDCYYLNPARTRTLSSCYALAEVYNEHSRQTVFKQFADRLPTMIVGVYEHKVLLQLCHMPKGK
jgi:hypothetical protein